MADCCSIEVINNSPQSIDVVTQSTTIEVNSANQTIEVNSINQTIEVNSASQTIDIVNNAPQSIDVVSNVGATFVGPITYVYDVTTPTTTYLLNHNLGYEVLVSLRDVVGREFDAQIDHTSTNQLIITTSTPKIYKIILR